MSGTPESLSDPEFLVNVHEARLNGFELCCADCGVGIADDSDEHDFYCPRNPDIDEHLDRARRFLAAHPKVGPR